MRGATNTKAPSKFLNKIHRPQISYPYGELGRSISQKNLHRPQISFSYGELGRCILAENLHRPQISFPYGELERSTLPRKQHRPLISFLYGELSPSALPYTIYSIVDDWLLNMRVHLLSLSPWESICEEANLFRCLGLPVKWSVWLKHSRQVGIASIHVVRSHHNNVSRRLIENCC